MDVNTFEKELSKIGIILNSYQLEQFEKYYHLLVEWNQKMNLTALTKKEDVYEKHFYDSILAAMSMDFHDQNICDIGAGAGFPSIPLKIVFPELKITIVDSLKKRIIFLDELIKTLELKNVKAIGMRAEEWVLDHREYYDVVMARAVARLNILNELCVPLLKINGVLIVLKGRNALEEIKEATSGNNELGITLADYQKYHLISDNDVRYIIKYDKIKKTKNKYPRNFSKIKNNPL
ncbi:MAG: 16S rRNA (guanine(527)-N(7))-methyltransferase RsmG [Bacilli bacterium]|jgi:16S rRNA (guanine527-N7)-methyltransferase|nr:16S rRNA (guanine(527)-N(7))-methyltransferase RsmG [Bacilli bacterium]